MDDYIRQYGTYDKKLIYQFNVGDGGIGDNIKFFMIILETCMKNRIRLYYKKCNIELEKHIKLKYDTMYISEDEMKTLDNFEIVTPYQYYSSVHYNYSIPIHQVFYFSDEIKLNRNHLFRQHITNYISIHLRLGDKYLETDHHFIACKDDVRHFSEEKFNLAILYTVLLIVYISLAVINYKKYKEDQ